MPLRPNSLAMLDLAPEKYFQDVPCIHTVRSGIFVPMTIGERIRLAREAMRENGKPVSRARFIDLMETFGVRRSEKALSNWESGWEGREPKLQDIEAMAKVTGRSVYWFLTGEEEAPPVEQVFDLRKWLDDPNAKWNGKPVSEEDKKFVEAIFRRLYSEQEKR